MVRRYSENVSYVDFLICSRSELDIEAIAYEYQLCPPTETFEEGELQDVKDALRLIDRLMVEGTYDNFCTSVRARIVSDEQRSKLPEIRQIAMALYDKGGEEFLSDLSNLVAGLGSANLEQRTKFNRLWDELALQDELPSRFPAMLSLMEPAKKPRGRKKLQTPWAGEVEHMNRMRLLRAGSAPSDFAAASICARDEGRGDQGERAKSLAKLYRKKLSVRN